MSEERIRINYHFVFNKEKDMDDMYNQTKKEIEECGGIVVRESRYDNDVSLTIELQDEDSYIPFIKHFKRTDSYLLTEEYKEEQDEKSFMYAVNQGYIYWTDTLLEKLLHNSGGWWGRRDSSDSWEQLAAFLNTGIIKIKGELYPHASEPSRDSEEWDAYYHAYSGRGNNAMGYMKWCAWNLLKKKGETHITFPTSLANVRSDNLGIMVKVGDGNPFQILYHILGHDWTYIHMPYGNARIMYTFEATDVFKEWIENFHFSFHHQEQEPHLLEQYMNSVKHIEEVRKHLQYQVKQEDEKKKKVAELQAYIERCQLHLFEDDDRFLLEHAVDIMKYDKELGTGEQVDVQKIKSLIKDGTLDAEKSGKTWIINKTEIIWYLQYLKNPIKKMLKEKRREQYEDIVTITSKPSVEWTEEMDALLLQSVLTNAKQGKDSYDTCTEVAQELGISWSYDVWKRWKLLYEEQYKEQVSELVEKWRDEHYEWWTERKDKILVEYVMKELKAGKSVNDIFSVSIDGINMNENQCRNRWRNKWSKVYKEEVALIRKEIQDKQIKELERKYNLDLSDSTSSNEQFKTASFSSADWDEEKEKILIELVLEKARNGFTMKETFQEASLILGIPPHKCNSYWYSKIPSQYREEFQAIRKEMRENWSEEDIQKLFEIMQITNMNEGFKIANKVLKRHVEDIRLKWLQLKKKKDIQFN